MTEITAEQILKDSLSDIKNNGWTCGTFWSNRREQACAVGLICLHGKMWGEGWQEAKAIGGVSWATSQLYNTNAKEGKEAEEACKALIALARTIPDDFMPHEDDQDHPEIIKLMREELADNNTTPDIRAIEDGVIVYNDHWDGCGTSSSGPEAAEKWFEAALAHIRD